MRTPAYPVVVGVLTLFGLLGPTGARVAGPRLPDPVQTQDSQREPQPDAETDAIRAATVVAKVTREWMNGKMTTPGISVETRESGRTSANGQPLVRYNAFVHGAPKDQLYALLEWPITQASPSELMKGLTISESGLVICAGRAPEQCVGEKRDDPVNFVITAAKGEVFRIALISEDGNTKIFFAVVPDPIVTKDKGCSLEAIRLLPRFELTLLRAKGYQPNEELLYASKSYDEAKEQHVKADEDGTFTSALLPFVKNKQNGKTDVRLQGASCSPALSFEWGK